MSWVLTALAAFVAALAAGVVTTAAGVGGGVALIALLAFFLEPQAVIVLVAPVLLVGNLSRFVLFRQYAERRIASYFLLGAIPAAVAGGLLLPGIPSRTLQVGMAVFLLVFIAQRVATVRRQLPLRIPPSAFLGVGLIAGFISSTVGGAGPFVAPFLEAAGLLKERFVGTMSAGTTGMNVAKVGAYVGGGLLTVNRLPQLAFAFVGIVSGNLIGRRMLGRVSDAAFRTVLLTVVGISAARLLIS